jgi:hypothetical protein
VSTVLNCQSADIHTTIQPPAAIVSNIQPASQMVLALQVGQGPAGPAGAPGVDGAPGPAGPPGPAGTADLHYSHLQASAAATWVVTHNLGKYPSVQVFDSAGDEVEGLVTQVSPNQLTINFSAAFSGVAYCN